MVCRTIAAHHFFLFSMLIQNEKQAHKLDVYLDHLNPNVKRELTTQQNEMLGKYLKIFAWRCKLFSPEQTRKLIMQEWQCSYSWACEMFNDMEYVFGNTEEINKKTTTRILIDHYYTAMQIAIKGESKDPFKAAELIIKITERIGELLQIGKGGGEEIPVELLMPKRQITYYVGTLNVQMNQPTEPTSIPITQHTEE